MDSLGRKFYDISERTRDRDFKQFMSELPVERVNNRNSSIRPDRQENAPAKMESTIESVKTLTKLIFAIASLVLAVKVIMKIMDEMEAMKTEDDEGAEGDIFDKIFGSEFQNKFANSALNKGEFKRRNEERVKRNIRDLSETTPLDEIKHQISHPGEPLVDVLKAIASGEEGCLKKLSRCEHSGEVFRIIFQGYTFREIMGDDSIGTRKQAAEYILSAFR